MSSYRNRFRTKADIKLGGLLAAVRVQQGVTQKELAERLRRDTGLEWRQVTISNIESGRTPCTCSQYVQIATALGIHHVHLPIESEDVMTPCVDMDDAAFTGSRPRMSRW